MICDRADIRIPLIFTVAAVLWILFSDMAIYAMYPELEDVHTASVLKGVAFVLMTGGLLFVLLRRERRHLLARDEEKRRLEEERRSALERLRMHIDRMPMGHIVTDREFRFVSFNPAAQDIFGFTEEEVRGRSPYGLIIPEEVKDFVEEVRRQWMQGSLDAHGTNENVTKDGRRIICDWFNTPVMDSEGRFDRLVSIVQDITDRREAEMYVELSRAQLRELTVRLDQVREEERVSLSREIHDGLGQLLTGMKIDLSLLHRMLAGADTNDTTDTGGRDVPAAARGGTTPHDVGEILDSLSKLTDSTIAQTRDIARRLRDGVLDDVTLADAIRRLSQETLERAGIGSRLLLPARRLPITDRQRLAFYRIVQEALTNVIRHAGATHVELSLSGEDGRAILEISDNGVGFPDNVRTDTLGLVGMRERAEMFGGFCHFLPRDGGGAVVHVEMPIQQEEEGHRLAEAHSHPSIRHGGQRGPG